MYAPGTTLMKVISTDEVQSVYPMHYIDYNHLNRQGTSMHVYTRYYTDQVQFIA
jgi:hypothetical protein